MPIRVLLADDEVLVRTGVKMILQHAPDIDVVAEAEDGARAVDLARRHLVDVALIDIRMPGTDGLAAAGEILRLGVPVQVVMLTTFGEEEYVARALRLGAAGFLLKDTDPDELIHAVRAAAGGQCILSPSITRRLVDRYVRADVDRAAQARRRIADLTERECEVLAMVGGGLSNADIGRRLSLVEGTVKTYVSRILTKLGCTNRVQAAILAHEAGILPQR